MCGFPVLPLKRHHDCCQKGFVTQREIIIIASSVIANVFVCPHMPFYLHDIVPTSFYCCTIVIKDPKSMLPKKKTVTSKAK